jgi:hypothetical protein
MDKRNFELAVVTGIKLLAAAGIAVVGYLWLGSLLPNDPWPPKDEREEQEIVARYKRNLLMGNSPLSPRTPEDTAVYLARILDHEVKKGELKSGREYTGQAIKLKLDGRVESLAGRPESKTLIAGMRNAVQKRDGLVGLVALYERRPGETAGKESKDRIDQELKGASDQFCRTPFDPAAYPELAEEIATIFRRSGLAVTRDSRLKEVIEEVRRSCLPRP